VTTIYGIYFQNFHVLFKFTKRNQNSQLEIIYDGEHATIDMS